jgi:hypothetical protein
LDLDLRFTPTTDREVIKGVMCRPGIFEALHDDFVDPVEEWEPIEAPGLVWYVEVHDGQEFLGLVILNVHSRVQVEIHQALLPHVGWKRRVLAAKVLFEWLSVSGFKRAIGKVVENRYAMKFNEAIGMSVFGCNPKAFMKGGELRDEWWFGIELQGVS